MSKFKDFLETSREFVDSIEGLTDEEKQKQMNMYTLTLFMDMHDKLTKIYNKVCLDVDIDVNDYVKGRHNPIG